MASGLYVETFEAALKNDLALDMDNDTFKCMLVTASYTPNFDTHTNKSDVTNELYFIPNRGNFSRGIFASLYTKYEGTLEEAKQLYKDYYKTAVFTHIGEIPVHLKQVVNTNKAMISLEKHGDLLLIYSAIDNLLKGASGQAVQNMNLMFGFDEAAGLQLKGSAF